MDSLTTDGTRLSTEDMRTVRNTARWAQFLGIVGLIMTALLVALTLAMSGLMRLFYDLVSPYEDQGVELDRTLAQAGLVYQVMMLIMAAIYAVPSYLLLSFAQRTKRAVAHAFDQVAYSKGLQAQQHLYIFMGIITIITLVFYGFALFGFLAVWLGKPTF